MNNKIIVTGGAGYIGSHFCKVASQAGYEITVVDNLSTGFVDLVHWGKLYEIDVRDTGTIKDIFMDVQPAYVVHFAASAYVGESYNDPLAYYDNNISGLQSVLAACVEFGCKIVFSSTCAVYGNPSQLPLTEDAALAPVNPYGDTKLACERMLYWCQVAYGLKWVSLRYFNAAGADPELEIGEIHEPETHLIPLILKSVGRDRGKISVFGSDYPTRDGTAIRDYVHVLDLARAHIKAIDFLERGGYSRAFNLGSGEGVSILEVINTVTKVSCIPVNYELCDRRSGDPSELFSNADKARELLGWNPLYSDLRTIIKTAWEWELLQRDE